MLTRLMNEFAPFAQLSRQMDRMLEGFFEDAPAQRPYSARYPGINLWEDGESAWVEAELPGLKIEDIDVLISGNELTINGERKLDGYDSATWQRRERAEGRFSRTVTLPWEIDADKVEAHLQDGVLSVKLPKCESCRPKKVKVLAK
jgi:HSP20 family protein